MSAAIAAVDLGVLGSREIDCRRQPAGRDEWERASQRLKGVNKTAGADELV